MSTNPKSVSNVNQKQGPRTGNLGTPGKRSEFISGKEERAPLARVVQEAYANRGRDETYVNEKLEPISSNSRRKFSK